MSNSYKFYSDTKDIMKKYVNATEGAIIYGISKSRIMVLASEAGAVYKVGNSALINTDIQRSKANNEAIFMKREKVIIDDYMEGLKILSKTYDDKLLMTFVSDFKSSNAYKESFNKSVELAKLRNVPENERIKSKADIDCYFRGGSLK